MKLWGFRPKPMCTVLEGEKLRIWIKVEQELYYLCSNNNDRDQLCSYCTADLLLCFCICIKNVFLMMGLN